MSPRLPSPQPIAREYDRSASVPDGGVGVVPATAASATAMLHPCWPGVSSVSCVTPCGATYALRQSTLRGVIVAPGGKGLGEGGFPGGRSEILRLDVAFLKHALEALALHTAAARGDGDIAARCFELGDQVVVFEGGEQA